MQETKLFVHFRELRRQTLAFAESIAPEMIDIVPAGFNNSIRWNLGHILVAWDYGIFPQIKENTRLPQSYLELFRKGTRPSSWTEEPPAYDELIHFLRTQADGIITASGGKMNNLIAKPFLRVKYLHGMFRFHLREEQHHLEWMKRIRDAIESTSAIVG
ncbi:DinB family protein [Gorillibacterium massiliense]|uniref:DinB family protein n=1 Tax=Gorillibacterium massiliense TaxID=1280390 RepID=UPI0004B13973|nr:DinB family protein [Gorillibacterium massiliense]